jgi:hypothetical protein
MKRCSKCNEIKALNQFCKRKDSKDGYRSDCKDCLKLYRNNYRSKNPEKAKAASIASYYKYRSKRLAESKKYYEKHKQDKTCWSWNYKLNKIFGITKDDYNTLLESQNGTCAICQQPETAVNQWGTIKLAVDHCHKTGKVRGLLCRNCNTSIGKLKESTEILQRAINYLNRDNK